MNLALESMVFTHGDHGYREDGMCAMEAYSRLMGLEHTADPACVPGPIKVAFWALNDINTWFSDDQRTRYLAPLIERLIKMGRRTPFLDQRYRDTREEHPAGIFLDEHIAQLIAMLDLHETAPLYSTAEDSCSQKTTS